MKNNQNTDYEFYYHIAIVGCIQIYLSLYLFNLGKMLMNVMDLLTDVNNCASTARDLTNALAKKCSTLALMEKAVTVYINFIKFIINLWNLMKLMKHLGYHPMNIVRLIIFIVNFLCVFL